MTLQDQNIVMHCQTLNHHISNSVQYFPSTFEAELADVIPVCYSSVAGCRYLARSTVLYQNFCTYMFSFAVFFYNSYNNQNHWTDDGGESARSSCAQWHHRPGASANQELFARQVTVFRTRTVVPLVMDCAENTYLIEDLSTA